jgi:hypothetical protein
MPAVKKKMCQQEVEMGESQSEASLGRVKVRLCLKNKLKAKETGDVALVVEGLSRRP